MEDEETKKEITKLEEEIRLKQEELKLKEEKLRRLKKNVLPVEIPQRDHNIPEHGNEPEIKTYGKRPGTIDHGKEFEYLMCGLYALKLSIDDTVKNFEMTSNNRICGDFDDVAIKVTFIDGKVKNYLIQLKHAEKSKDISRSELESSNGNFSIIKYLKSYGQIKNLENLTCILFTNRRISYSKEIILNRQKINIKQLPQKHLLNTSEENNSIFYFEESDPKSEEIQKFFQHFYFFTNQKNCIKVEHNIKEIINNLVGCQVDFIKFMNNWWKGNFVLTKHDVIIKLVEMTFSPFIKEIIEENTEIGKKSLMVRTIIQNFDITIVKDDDNGLVQKLWYIESVRTDQISKTSLKYGLTIDGIKDIDVLSPIEKSKILWYLNKAPLIINFDRSHQNIFNSVIKLLEIYPERKNIVLVGNATRTDFPNWKIFENLHDLKNEDLYFDIIKEFKISLQGRPSMPLEQLLGSNDAMLKVIGSRELLLMTQEDLHVGQIEEDLPGTYIPRTVSTLVFSKEEIIKTCDFEADLLIFNCDDHLKFTTQNRKIQVVELREYFTQLHPDEDQFTNLVITAIKNKCTKSDFKDICAKTNKNVHLLQIIDEENCILISSKNGHFQGLHLEENRIHDVLKDPINVICARPGLGKSTMMTYLSIQCPRDHLSVRINLIKYNSFFKRRPNNDQILSYFLQDGDYNFHRIKSVFDPKMIYLFLDGLDEIDGECVPQVLDFVKYASDCGLHIWISSRENLKEMITDYLNSFSVDIEELNEQQQKSYIEKRLSESSYRKEEIENISKTIFTSVSIISNSKNLLGVPLQLFIITEIFRLDRNNYENLNEGTFVLTTMYKLFFEGKKAHQDEKAKIENKLAMDDAFYYSLKQFEIPGLQSTLEGTLFEKLVPKKSRELAESEVFLKKLKSQGNKLGIINQVIREGRNLQAIFTHQSYAEYFACVWLKHNQDKLQIIRDEFFSKKYQNLRLIFDIMLAEDRPLHLATIYKSPQLVSKYLHCNEDVDEGGRTALHIFCTYGSQWNEQFTYNIKDMKESLSYSQIFDLLLDCDSTDPFQSDKLFQMNCLDYSLKSHCLYPFEAILKFVGKDVILDDLLQHFHGYNLAICCAYLGYTNLLKALIEQEPNIAQLRLPNDGKYLLHMCVEGSTSDSTNTQTIEMLVRHGLNIDVIDQSEATPLHIACEFKNQYVVKAILDLGADIKAKNYRNYTPLHCAAKNNEFGEEIIALLLQNGAKINALDKDGYSALHIACTNSHSGIVKILIQNGADIHGMADGKHSVLDCATRNVAFGKDIVKLLVDKGVCQRNHLLSACLFGNYGVVKTLLDLGSEVAPLEKDTILLCAIQNKAFDQDIIKLLVRKGANVNAKNSDGYSVLHLTCMYGKLIAVEAVVECGGDIEAVSDSNCSPLHCAVQNIGFGKDVINFLIEKGANVNARDQKGYSVLHIACRFGSCDAVNTIVTSGGYTKATTDFGETPLHCAAKNHEFGRDIINLLLDTEADINATDTNGYNILHTACQFGNVSIVKTILQRGADINICTNTGDKPLHCAAKNCKFGGDIIAILCRKKIDIDEQNASGYNPLHIACYSGSTDSVNAIIESGGDITATSATKDTVLHFATHNHTFGKDIVVLLLAKGANVNAINDNGYSILHEACQFGNPDIVTTLLDHGANININAPKITLLNCAVVNPCFGAEIIKLLVERGVDINSKNDNGYNALHVAAEYGNRNPVKALLDNGGDINSVSNRNDSILHCAAVNCNYGKDIIGLLLTKGANINAINDNGYSALHMACAYGSLETVIIILENGGNLMATVQKRYSVLHCAAQNSAFGEVIIPFLVNQGASINATDKNGYSVLHVACQFSNCNTVNAVLASGGNINVTSNIGDTVLHCAVINNDKGDEIVNLLLERGADVNGKNNNGYDVLQTACQFGTCDVVTTIIENGGDFNAVTQRKESVLHCAAQNQCFGKDIIRMLVQKGTKINAITDYGYSVLHIACLNGSFENVATIIDNGGDINAIGTNDGYTMLHCAAKNGEFAVEIINHLLNLGLSINVVSKMRYTALHTACKYGNVATVALLLNRGASVNAVNDCGYNVLHSAVQNLKFGKEIVQMLLWFGANVNASDNYGFSVLHAACQFGTFEMVGSLLQEGADIQAYTDTHCSVLHCAALNSEFGKDIVKILINRGANVRAINKFGCNALNIAIRKGNNEVAETLVEYGAAEASCCSVL